MSYLKLAAGLGVIAMLYAMYWGIDHGGYTRGRDKVKAEWNADKAIRKLNAEKQAINSAKTDQEHKNALENAKKDINNSRRDLAAALKRLRNVTVVPRGNTVSVADSGGDTVPNVAGNPGGIDIRVEQRIGSCEDTGSDPCAVTRGFFEQAIGDAMDRKLTREWAIGQGIKTVGVKDGDNR